jgi:hypothetical protein
MVLVIVPTQHEITDEALRFSEFDRDVQDVFTLCGVDFSDALLQGPERLFARARDAVEIAVHGFVLEDQHEIVEVLPLKGPQHETRRLDGLE